MKVETFEGVCLDCGGFLFRPGPSGGMSQNIECVNEDCGARLNVAFWHGQWIMAQRIPSERDGGGAWREDLFPKVCQ
jgi:hypothetical protein